jgi:SMI1-KNR4 cell-wall
MWREYLSSISKKCQFKASATKKEILSIEKELNVDLPEQLADLYNETNGVYGNYGISFIWSIDQMVKENLFFWTIHEYSDYMLPLDTFLFFSDAGNGDLFGYSIVNGSIQTDDIYVWNHEDDSRSVIASSLEEFIRGWIIGEISV